MNAIIIIFDTSVKDLKNYLGPVIYPFLLNGFTGGALPIMIEAKLNKKCFLIRDIVLSFTVYGITSITCNYMYIYFSIWFGDGIDAKTIFIKVFIDQFIYMAFWRFIIFIYTYYCHKYNMAVIYLWQ